MRRSGFSLLELAVAMMVLAVMAGAAVPFMIGHVRQEAGQRAARDMLAVLDAGKAFYTMQSPVRWPSGIWELKNAGYLPGWFTETTPFGTSYWAGPNGTQYRVTAVFPPEVAPGVARLLPLGTQNWEGGWIRVWAAMPMPGLSADLSQVLHRQGMAVDSFMTGQFRTSTPITGKDPVSPEARIDNYLSVRDVYLRDIDHWASSASF